MKVLKQYDYEDMSKARLEGFMDCLQIMGDNKLTREEIDGLVKGYRSIWRREYMKYEQRDD